MSNLRDLYVQALPDTVALLKQLAALESPSHNKTALDACVAFVASQLHALGAEVTLLRQPDAGNQIQATWPGTEASTQFLTLCHLDTVWPIGTLAKNANVNIQPVDPVSAAVPSGYYTWVKIQTSDGTFAWVAETLLSAGYAPAA